MTNARIKVTSAGHVTSESSTRAEGAAEVGQEPVSVLHGLGEAGDAEAAVGNRVSSTLPRLERHLEAAARLWSRPECDRSLIHDRLDL